MQITRQCFADCSAVSLMIRTPEYWSTRRIGRQSQRTGRVSEMNMALRTPFGAGSYPNKEGVRLSPHPLYLSPCCSGVNRWLPGHDFAQALFLFAAGFFLRIGAGCVPGFCCVSGSGIALGSVGTSGCICACWSYVRLRRRFR